ncbi:MAG: HdeA/HdeB family chaperone [Methylomonas sp.]
MKSNLIMAILSGVLISSTMISPVLAEAQKPESMTCDEFVGLDDVVKPKVVYWMDGFNKKGKLTNSVVDIEQTDNLVPTLVTACKETPKNSLSKTEKKNSASSQKPATHQKSTNTLKPVHLTCDQFVELDDVVKPKVVYWAEGYNKKGKPTGFVVDFDDMDKLVPTVVTECKETPKLSFWDKIKKHF